MGTNMGTTTLPCPHTFLPIPTPACAISQGQGTPTGVAQGGERTKCPGLHCGWGEPDMGDPGRSHNDVQGQQERARLSGHRLITGTQQWGHKRGPEWGTGGTGGPRALKPSTGLLTMKTTLSSFPSFVSFPVALFLPFLLQGLSANSESLSPMGSGEVMPKYYLRSKPSASVMCSQRLSHSAQ